ncbi:MULTISPECIES: ABC transporter ATP-binding protein [unclassified Methanoregula]|uniref:ABC transporter ATP-binding protein n=1 Tax=unclassified Methanoregula TaxID=2649730 RepID=UPI0009CE6E88|nr:MULTISPECIES: ABC transporter ATP-binding protein [unclassified Methanoregula]OPX64369.1 MAG: putative ABC transporter ATP-binding protein [Methanoregula sp. PtaB.Bin085]OPY34961.1 MAG: putative ABC transporter ATP-binding protein [Methanoregula sp. PtaU1.Bin006]
MTLLSVEGLNVRFPTGDGTVHASRDVSFSMEPGEVLGLVGETGSGKSVIGQAIIRLLPASAKISGDIFFDGQELTRLPDQRMHALRGRTISLVPQNPSGSLDPLVRNGMQIAEIFIERGEKKQAALDAAKNLLVAVGLIPSDRIAREYPHELSGGMRQRLTTSIAIAEHSRLIIADEPTKGLDYHARETTARVLAGIREREQASLLLITHDLYLAERLCDRIAVLYAGEIIEIGPASQVFRNPRHPYTQALIRAMPKNGLVPLEGQSPSLMALPMGCSFASRCSFMSDRCCTDHPGLIQDDREGGVRCHNPCSG